MKRGANPRAGSRRSTAAPRSRPTLVNPAALGAPSGYSQGVLAPTGRLLFVSGQVGWSEDGRIVSGDFAAQFGRALERVLEVVREAGGTPESLVRLTIFVKDKREYLDARREVGRRWRERLGKRYPAVSLVEVADLLDPEAKVEIEATAVV